MNSKNPLPPVPHELTAVMTRHVKIDFQESFLFQAVGLESEFSKAMELYSQCLIEIDKQNFPFEICLDDFGYKYINDNQNTGFIVEKYVYPRLFDAGYISTVFSRMNSTIEKDCTEKNQDAESNDLFDLVKKFYTSYYLKVDNPFMIKGKEKK